MKATCGLDGRRTREYNAWRSVIDRCYRPSMRNFRYYGGRGIAMCERWRVSYAAFLSDMGPCPVGHTLERIDNDRNYEPENCRWATWGEQQANRRSSRHVVIDGERMTASAAARKHGVPIHRFFRYLDYGMPVEDIIAGKKHRRRWHVRPS